MTVELHTELMAKIYEVLVDYGALPPPDGALHMQFDELRFNSQTGDIQFLWHGKSTVTLSVAGYAPGQIVTLRGIQGHTFASPLAV